MSPISLPLRLLRSRHIPTALILPGRSRPILQNATSFRTARTVSTSSTAAADASSLVTRLKNILYGTSLTVFIAFGYIYITDTRASVHQWLVVPSLRWICPDAEDAHHIGTKALKALYEFGLHPRERPSRSQKEADISVVVYGQRLHNPIGTSAGIDKLAEVPDALFALGPAIVEVGGTTPFAQDGNPKPRVFRLPSQRALINRYGLNSLGADDMARRLRERVRLYAHRKGYGEEGEQLVLSGGAGVPPGSLQEGKLLAVQVAKNKDTKDGDIEAVRKDYVYCVERLAPYADILVVNVSSPNTPGLRALQQVEPLTRILEGVVEAAKAVKRANAPTPRVMVKVSPDEDQDEQIEGIVEAIWRSGVDGVIVGNTTKRRNLPQDIKLSTKERRILQEQGGLSGPHMFERTLDLVKRYRRLLDEGPPSPLGDKNDPKITNPDSPASAVTEKLMSAKSSITGSASALVHSREQKVIFATGGITNGKQALEILNAGASIAQIYTALIYGGVGTVTRIKKEMTEEIRKKK